MTLQQTVTLALQISILLTVFGFGLQASVDDIGYLLRRPKLLAKSLAAMFLVMPIFAVVLSEAFELRPAVEIALVALAISPVPPLLPGKERRGGGNVGYGLGLMGVVSVLSIVVVPTAADLLGRWVDRSVNTPVATIARIVITAAILPLGAGVLVNTVAPRAALRLARPVAVVGTVLLACGAVILLIATLPAAMNLIGGGTLLAMVAFVVAGLGTGHLLGAPNPEQSTVLALSTATRHPAIALAIATANFPNEPYLGATIVLYLLVAAVVSLPYVWRQQRLTTVTA